MSRWWRAHDDSVDHEKLLLLSDRQHRAWYNLMCLSSANGGCLPDIKIIALKLRMTEGKTRAIIDQLVAAGLFDDNNGQAAPHNWDKRQFKSDVSTDRVQRFRERKRNVSVTPPENRGQNTEEDKTADAVVVPKKKYAFEGGIIKLSQKHFDNWTKAYPNLFLPAELTARDAWFMSDRATDDDRKNWYISTSKYLANQNQAARTKASPLRPADFTDQELLRSAM